jgi:hypothetical protein
MDFDAEDFWEQSEYADREYVDEPLTDAMVAEVERSLGYKLPAAYVAMMKAQNGGIPKRRFHKSPTRTTWAEDHVAVHGISGIGSKKTYSLCGPTGSQFWIDEWGYPAIGVYFADCPSAGHDMFCLDYQDCGPTGEPRVVHIDQEWDYKVTEIARTFESFILGLQTEDAFDKD